MDENSNRALELELLQRIQRGDETALATLLDRTWPAVVAYATTILGDADRAQDAAQETFVRLWERRESWALDGSLRGLLFRLVRNLSLDELRRSDAQARAASQVVQPSPRTPEDDAETAGLNAAIAAAVRALPPRRRDVFLLIRYHGLPVREAAQVLGIATQTAANHLNMALASLRTTLAPLMRRPP